MRFVIYDKDDHEPITVISLPKWACDVAMQRGHVRVHAMPKFDPKPFDVQAAPEMTVQLTIITLSFEPVYKGKELLMWLVYADDPVSALLLKSTFLPGQRGEINKIKREAFMNGLIEGLSV